MEEKLEPVRKINKILCAIDGSEYSLRAGLRSMDLAKNLSAELILVHVASYPVRYYGLGEHTLPVGIPVEDKHVERLKQSALDVMQKISRVAKDANIPVSTAVLTTESSIAEEIITYSMRNGIDLIVVGTRGLNEFQRSLVGSISTELVEKANCSVFVVR